MKDGRFALLDGIWKSSRRSIDRHVLPVVSVALLELASGGGAASKGRIPQGARKANSLNFTKYFSLLDILIFTRIFTLNKSCEY